MNQTKIEWCDCTVNPVVGCTYGCPFCYARRLNDRFHFVKDFSRPVFFPERLKQLESKKPKVIFMDSMSDIADWKPEWIEQAFTACKENPQHKYLFLTKRPYRYTQLLVSGHLIGGSPIWIGTTLTDKGKLPFNALDSKQNFISVEPILGPMSDKFPFTNIQWVIVGAETGPNAVQHRPSRRWIQDIVDQCRAVGVPVFMKNSLRPIWGEPLIQEFPW